MVEREIVEVLHVIFETICVIMSRTFFQVLLNLFFFENLMPKVKTITSGIFYRPLNENNFFDIF